ncbi:efflux RND transporter periplasmic adaptor subunit [Acidovorax sp. SUPP1855]|uniref:efflux RND transporter periplasmic adaptor subunit n=1 Tax=Acidovorax sp. SUPP1855 TaxID=431774 RepID=UPI0023DE42A7|nr:efflux RND transporter periplasmic adaptor subunit [Acidovorax sp. SUPP1855]GKS86203.1 efflux RND transporter periplasmic adaptor subunit [Acidovorax sp. SUPP1855]
MISKALSNRKRVLAGVVAAAVLAAGFAWRVSLGVAGTPAARTQGQGSESASALTVQVVSAETQTWPQPLQASGALAAWQEIIVSPETSGLRIAELLVDVGSTVRRGQLMARLADGTVKAELRKQEALVAQARASLGQAGTNLRRAQAVDVAGALAPQKMDEYRANEATAQASLASAQADLESARLKLSHTRIVAADDGVVASRSAVLGNVVNAGAELFRLVRQGRVEWRAELDARQLANVRVGQGARLVLPSGMNADGTVRLVSPTLSATTGRGTVYVSLAPGQGAQAGQFASGTIDLGSRAAITLPQSAIVLRDGRSYVYVLDDQQRATSRVITVGRRHGDRVEVVSGLEPRWRVVASGGAFLSEGASVTVASVDARPAPAGGDR